LHGRASLYHILASKPRGVLYVGVTTTLPSRIEQHKSGAVPGSRFADIRDRSREAPHHAAKSAICGARDDSDN
jgi:predicted GIY-YIG superfamily endonuclease